MTYEEIKKLIQSRTSLYPAQMQEGGKIPDEDIRKLLALANHAPNHKRTEPWRFIVFAGKQVKEFYEQMGNIYREITPKEEFEQGKVEKFRGKAESVSHVIAIAIKRDEQERLPADEEAYATACAVQNMYLGLKSLNIIGYWGTGEIAYTEQMKKFLGLGEKDHCMGFLQLGVPKDGLPDVSKTPKTPIDTKVEWR
jgi:nitroreductase